MKSLKEFISEQLITEHFVNCKNEEEMRKYGKVVWDILTKAYEYCGGIKNVNGVEDLIKDVVKSVNWLLNIELNEDDKEMVENIVFNAITEKVFHYISIDSFPNSFRDIAEEIENMQENDVIDFDSVKISGELEGIREEIKRLKLHFLYNFNSLYHIYSELFDENTMELANKVKIVKEISKIIGDLSKEELEYCLS